MLKQIRFKRVISGVLCLILLVNALPLDVFAVGESGDVSVPPQNIQSITLPTQSGNENTYSSIPAVDYPTKAEDLLEVEAPQTVEISTERPPSFVENSASELIYENGYAGVAAAGFASGSGSAEEPYIIETGAELRYFADQVNAGNTFEGQYIRLKANIDLNGYDWTPIGYCRARVFEGNFNGEYHEVKNMTITYHRGSGVEADVYYIGFFGYINGARIEALGISDYTVNQTFSFHTVIGGFVSFAEYSIIRECYANGDVETHFDGKYYMGKPVSLKGQAGVYTISSIAGICTGTSGIANENILIDLSGLGTGTHNIGKTITISPNTKTVQFIGRQGAVFTNFTIYIENRSTELNLIFEDFHFRSSGKPLWSYTSSQINLYSCGTSNLLGDGTVGETAMWFPDASVTIMGPATITFRGGIGAAGANKPKAASDKNGSTGGNASNGFSGVYVKNLLIYANRVECKGGAGGAGGKGGAGNTWLFAFPKNGGKGGTGGAGGIGLDLLGNFAKIRGTLYLQGGAGGAGGQGGTAGWAGKGGTGGKGGDGAPGLYMHASSPYYYGENDMIKSGGAAGAAGAKGSKGSEAFTSDGSPGSPGNPGAAQNKSYTVRSINEYTASPLITDYALLIGGFIGCAGNGAFVEYCVAQINSITIPSYFQGSVCRYFVAESHPPASGIAQFDYTMAVWARDGQSGIHTYYESYDGSATVVEVNASLLSNDTDKQGLIYSSGIDSQGGALNVLSIVLGRVEGAAVGDIVIPDFVYGGHFLRAVTRIDDGAFWENDTIRGVSLISGTWGTPLEEIGEAAFMGSAITSFDDAGAGVYIGLRAFANCKNLTVADVSSSFVNGYTFYGCSSLSTVTLSDQQRQSAIASATFYNCTSLKTITIPKNVTRINRYAFYGAGLISVDFSKATCLDSIYDSAFAYTPLQAIDIPDSVTYLEERVFYGCTELSSVQLSAGIKEINEGTFHGCSALHSIVIPENVTRIDAAFGGCTSLMSMTVPFVGSDRDDALADHFGYIFGAASYQANGYAVPASLTSVTISEGITSIADYAFCWCENLQSVAIPSTVTSIGTYAFCACGLNRVTVPDTVETIGYASFSNCPISEITIPFVGQTADGTENTHFGYIFGADTYHYNEQYVPENISVTISDRATKIADYAFSGCETMSAVNIGSSVETIGNYAFYDCLGIESIVIPDSVTTIGKASFGKSAGRGKMKSFSLGNGVTTIGVDLLVGRTELTSITIGAALAEIPDIDNGKSPFGIEKINSELEAYYVNAGNADFAAKDGILYELFNADLTVGGQKLKVAVIDVPKMANLTSYQSSGITIMTDDENKVAVSGNHEFYIMRIYPYAFAYNTAITEVHLDYVRSIGDGAFSNCSNLKTVAFGEYSESENVIQILEEKYPEATESYTTEVGDRAFENCTKLESVNLESNVLTRIGFKAFYNVAGAAKPLSITLGKNITAISVPDPEDETGESELQVNIANMMGVSIASAFQNANISEFNVVEGNSKFFAIDGVLFYRSGENVANSDKESLWLAVYPGNAASTEYAVPVSLEEGIVTHISPQAFYGAAILKELTISDGVQTVGWEAFVNMTALTALHLGADVYSLDLSSPLFDGCGALQRISVDENNARYAGEDGVLTDKIDHTLIKYPEAKPGRDYTTPDYIQNISEEAFNGNTALRQVTLSNEILYMGTRAFYDCPNLSFIYFEKGDCPFLNVTTVKSSNAFDTKNARVLVCYGEVTERWALVGSEEANATYYSNQATQGGQKRQLFQISEYEAYPTNASSDLGYYAVVVLNHAGERLNGINVAIGDKAIDTINGISMFDVQNDNLEFGKSYNLRLFDNLGEYFPFENTDFYLDKDTRITYITLNSVPTVSGVRVTYDASTEEAKAKIKEKMDDVLTEDAAASIIAQGKRGYDLNSETAKVNKWLIDEIVITVSCAMEKGTAVNGYKLVQNGKDIPNVKEPVVKRETIAGKDIVTIEFTVSTAELEVEQDIYAVVQTGVGTAQCKLNIQIIYLDYQAIDLSWLSTSLNIDIPDWLVDVLGFDHDLQLDVGQSGVKFNVVAGDDSFKIAISYNMSTTNEVNPDDSAIDFQTGKTVFEEWKESLLQSPEKLFTISTSDKDSEKKLNVSLGGYIEFKYKGLTETGEPDFALDSQIFGLLGFTYECGTTIQVYAVPVRLEAEMTLEGGLKYGFVFDKEAQRLCTPNVSYELKGELGLYAGVGFACLSAGVYGKIETVLVIEVLPQPGLEQLTMDGELGAYFKYKLGPFEHTMTHKLLETSAEHPVYQRPDEFAAILAEDVSDEANYAFVVSSYAPMMVSETPTEDGVNSEPASAYSGIMPQLVQVGDLIYIFYQDDMLRYDTTSGASYDQYNYQKIVYQTYNTVTEELSEVTVLDDNGLADGAFAVASYGSQVVVVYSQLKEKLTGDMIGDASNYVSRLEVKTAILNDNGVAYTQLTEDAYSDSNARIGVVNGNLTAVWVKNMNNSLLGYSDPTKENAMSSICYSTYGNGAWSAVSELGGLNTITDLELGGGYIAYITDMDNALATVGEDGKYKTSLADRVITLMDISGESATIVSEQNAYYDLSCMENELVYYLNNNIYFISTDGGEPVIDAEQNPKLRDTALENLTETYEILKDGNGNVKAILYIVTEETCSNLYGIFRNGNKWGAPIRLTDLEDNHYVNSYDAIDFGSEMLLSVLVSQTDMEVLQSNEEAANSDLTSQEDLEEFSEIYSYETYMLAYPTEYTVGEIEFDYESVKPNQTVTLRVPISNHGYQSLYASDIPVSITGIESCKVLGFYDENGNALEDNLLLSGETGYLHISFRPEEVQETEYHVFVNGNDRQVTLWYSDFVVTGKQVVIGNTYHIVALVKNDGYLSGNYSISAVCDDNVIWNNDGQPIFLESGKSKYLMIPLETTFDEASRLITVSVNAPEEYKTTNNEARINVATESDISEQVKLSSKSFTIDRNAMPESFTVGFETGYTLNEILVNDVPYTGIYSTEANSLIFDTASMVSALGVNGIYIVTLVFSEENNVEVQRSSTFAVKLTEFYTITWNIDGIKTPEKYEIGSLPTVKTPVKASDDYYNYVFERWDKEIAVVTENVEYEAIFSEKHIQYSITWVVDGKQDEITKINSLELPGHIDPTKESDAEWDYTFAGWSPVIKEATEDCVYTAEFTKTPRKYTVTWIVNGVEVNEEYTYGQTPAKNNPQNYSDNENYYTFNGWDKEVVAVTENAVYTATWTAEPKAYLVTWNVDGTKTYANYTYEQMPVYGDGAVPKKDSTDQYEYTFIGWSPEITSVTKATEYTAQFREDVRKYTVKWTVDGVTEEQTLPYGELPVHADPTKPSDAQYDYVFNGWDQEISKVYGDQEYVAKFTPVLRTYTVTWIVDEIEYHSSVYYNTTPSFEGSLHSDQVKEAACYIFKGWDKEIVPVTKDTTYTAVFEHSSEHPFTSEVETDESGNRYIVYNCECGYSYRVAETLFTLSGANMTLGNSLAMNFAIGKTHVDAAKVADNGYYAVIIRSYSDGKEDVAKIVQSSEWTDYNSSIYAVTYDNIAAKEMIDTIKVQIFNADGTAISKIWLDSIRSYAMRMVDGGEDVRKTFMVDMLNYGAAAQVHFGYATDDLANSLLTDVQAAYGTKTVSMSNIAITDSKFYGMSLFLESSLAVTVAFKDMNVDDIPNMKAVATFTDHTGKHKSVTVLGKDFTVVNVDKGVYGVKIFAAVVADVRQPITFTIYNKDGTVYATAVDSIESYLARMDKKYPDNPLYESVMKFCASAYTFLHRND